MPEVSLILDTNVFLQYQGIESIPWLDLVQAKRIELLIVPPVTTELDRKKFAGTKREKERADAAIRKLKSWLLDGAMPHLPVGVSIRDIEDLPKSFLENQEGDLTTPDAQIVAHAKHLVSQSADRKVLIVTADMGLQLRAKRSGITFFELPEATRLKSEEDEASKQMSKLNAELNRYKSRSPRLGLKFSNDSSHAQVSLRNIPELDKDEHFRLVESIKASYPHRSIESLEGLTELQKVAFQFTGPSNKQWADYNKELDEFYKDYSNYLWTKRVHDQLDGRTARFELILENTGLLPASDVRVQMHFPDGFFLFSDDKPSECPDEPKPPFKPRSFYENFAMGPNAMIPDFMREFPVISRNNEPANVTGLTIKQTNSYDVTCKVRKLQHQDRVSIGRFRALFESLEEARSFEISVRLLCDELSDPSESVLNIKIERD